MAVVKEVTLSTGSTVRVGDQSREVGVALTYRLEPEDGDVLQFVRERAAEVARAHQVAWKSIRDEKESARNTEREGDAPPQDIQVLADQDGPTEPNPATETQLKAIQALVRASTQSDEEFQASLRDSFGCSSASELSRKQAGGLLVELQRRERQRVALLRGMHRQAAAAR